MEDVLDNGQKKPDIFDKIMHLGFLKKFEPLYKKNKEVLLYLFFGALTTLISFITYLVPSALLHLPKLKMFNKAIDINLVISNIISWICAVTFSYVTARIWVFATSAYGARAVVNEAAAFYSGRIFTLIVETVIIYIGVDIMSASNILMKALASIFVLVLNYFISKLFVFKKIKE